MFSESVQQCCGVPEEAHISVEEESDGCGGKMRGFLSCAEFSQYSQCSDIHHSPPLSTSSSILSQSKGMRKWRNVLIMFRTKAEGLTTGGGLATFVDLGSTVEKNLIYQMVHIGKRVLMMRWEITLGRCCFLNILTDIIHSRLSYGRPWLHQAPIAILVQSLFSTLSWSDRRNVMAITPSAPKAQYSFLNFLEHAGHFLC
nr:hypothetical protein TEA_027171 [Ipomoea trifida]